jgi:hypothetical protein
VVHVSTSLEVRALLDAGRAQIAAALAMEAKGNPAIAAMKEKSRKAGAYRNGPMSPNLGLFAAGVRITY